MSASSFLFRLVALGAAGGAIALAYNHFDVQAKKAELLAEKPLLEELRRKLENVEADLDTAKQEMALLEEEIARRQSAHSHKIDIPALEAERDGVWAEFASHVQKVRNSLVGKPLPDNALEKGQVPQGTLVQKVLGTELTVSHPQGIARIPLSSLNADLRLRLRVGMSPPDPRSPPESATPTPVVAAASSSAMPQAAPPPAEPQLTTDQKERIAKIQAEINIYAVQVVDLDRTKNAYLRQANDYRIKDAKSIYMGQRPRYANIIPRIDAASRELMGRIGEIRVKIADLQIQIEGIKAGAQ